MSAAACLGNSCCYNAASVYLSSKHTPHVHHTPHMHYPDTKYSSGQIIVAVLLHCCKLVPPLTWRGTPSGMLPGPCQCCVPGWLHSTWWHTPTHLPETQTHGDGGGGGGLAADALAETAAQRRGGCIVLGGILRFICLTDRTHRERGAPATAAAASASAEMAVKRQDGCIVLGGILQLVRLRCRQTGTPTAAAAAATLASIRALRAAVAGAGAITWSAMPKQRWRSDQTVHWC